MRFLCYGAQRGRARRECPIASLDLSTVYSSTAKLYVDKVEFAYLSLREGVQSSVEKVYRSRMSRDTNQERVSHLYRHSKASLALALTRSSSLYVLVSL